LVKVCEATAVNGLTGLFAIAASLCGTVPRCAKGLTKPGAIVVDRSITGSLAKPFLAN
jgi:hypothetical protein